MKVPLTLWSLPTGRRERRLPPLDWPWAAAFSSDGRWLAAAYYGRMVIWETSAWRKIAVLPTADAAYSSLQFSPDSRWLAAGGREASTALYTTAGWRPLRLTPGRGSGGAAKGAVLFSPDSAHLAVLQEGRVSFYRLPGGAPESSWRLGGRHAANLAISPDGRRLATDGDDSISRSVRVWKMPEALRPRLTRLH